MRSLLKERVLTTSMSSAQQDIAETGGLTQHLIARGNDALNGVPPRGRRGRFNFLAEANSPNRRSGQFYTPLEGPISGPMLTRTNQLLDVSRKS